MTSPKTRETGSPSEADSDSVSSDGVTDSLEDMVAILDKDSPQLDSGEQMGACGGY